MTASRVKRGGAVLLASIMLAGAQTGPARSLYASACHFVEYYRALEDSKDIPAGFLERVRISVALANADARRADVPAGNCTL